MPKKRHQNKNLSKTDGFHLLQADKWYFDKLGIIQSYLKAYNERFDLRNKTKMLVYIGAGPGLVLDTKNEKEKEGTPLAILSSKHQFQRYLFCENNSEYAQALKVRIGKSYPDKHTVILEGDINQTIEKLPPYIPDKIAGAPAATLCIIDLQSFDLHYETLEILASMDVDFLLVNSFVHSEYYNYNFYLEEERETMNAFFGSSWARLAETSELNSDTSFFLLVVKAYLEQMKHLGYSVTGTLHKYKLENPLVPYYQIAYCTKSKVLKSLKQKAVMDTSKQIELFK